MKKVTDAISKTIEERMTNPLVGTFAISWLIFNWRPILFFIFSKKDIEHKIFYIKYQFSNPCNILVWPLIIAFFYVLALPYITAYLESLVKSAIDKKAKNQLDRDIQIRKEKSELVLEDIRLEKIKTNLLEEQNNNVTIETLNETITKLREANIDLQRQFEQERLTNVDRVAKINSEHEKRYNTVQEELDELIKTYNEANGMISDLNKEAIETEIKMNQLESKNNSLRYQLEARSEVEILLVNNVARFIKMNQDKGEIYYYDLLSETNWSFSMIKKLVKEEEITKKTIRIN